MNRSQFGAAVSGIQVPLGEYDRAGSRAKAVIDATVKYSEVLLSEVPAGVTRDTLMQDLAAFASRAVTALTPTAPVVTESASVNEAAPAASAPIEDVVDE
jgi:hypothetical protein